ncbi:MAG TPA: toprim domain-containing protein, partial [Thermomicrobiales bacterium]|nr:toprim domain-containing protein [Thermomicrobiales bacterium]
VEFREALNELARRAGVELASLPAAAPEVDAHRERLIELNELAAAFYVNILLNSQAGATGRDVAEQRGLSPEIIQRFGLGYALDQWDALLRYLTGRGVDPALAAEAGLLQQRDQGGWYDRFRNRFVFPIRTREGRTVGFGARALGDAQPKYLNSAQSAIFDKSALVYGLDLAKEAIRERDQVVVVEGYMDAIAAHQFGHPNVVAAMGTAVTEAQIGQVKRLSRHIVLALDADAAGQMATLRSLEMLPRALDGEMEPVVAPLPGPDARAIVRWERKLNADIAIVRLPEGKDPDELIRRNPERWPDVIAAAQPFLDFVVETIAAGVSADDGAAKSAAVQRVAPILQSAGDRVVQAHYAGLLARKLGLPNEVVYSELRRLAMQRPAGGQRAGAPAAAVAPVSRFTPPRASHEDHLLALLLAHRALLTSILPLAPEADLLDSRNRELLLTLRDETIPLEMEPAAIVAGLDDAIADHAERLLAELAETPARYPGEIERDARKAVERIRKERFDQLMRQLRDEIAAAQQAGEHDLLLDLRDRLALLTQEIRQFDPPPSPYFRDSRDDMAHRPGSRPTG